MALGAVLLSGHVWEQPALNQLRKLNTGQGTYRTISRASTHGMCAETGANPARLTPITIKSDSQLPGNVQNAPRQGIKRRQDSGVHRRSSSFAINCARRARVPDFAVALPHRSLTNAQLMCFSD